MLPPVPIQSSIAATSSAPAAPATPSQLARMLGTADLAFTAIGIVIGSGIFLVPGLVGELVAVEKVLVGIDDRRRVLFRSDDRRRGACGARRGGAQHLPAVRPACATRRVAGHVLALLNDGRCDSDMNCDHQRMTRTERYATGSSRRMAAVAAQSRT